ncbi:hypothetical protein NC651_009139 [Populus alba x Populus x berolinensis]|nr:hypothetical protein NC651_009139 [Populus alba x Populus x berolinensis]
MGFYGVDDAVGLWCDFGNWFFMALGFVFSFATYVGAVAVSVAQDDDDLGGGGSDFVHPSDNPSTSRPMLGSARRERINKMRRKRKITWMLSFGSWLLLLIQIKWPTCSKAILAQFTEEQMSRYESFRRSALQKTNMKRATFVMKERKESGPTRPCHSREAYRRLKLTRGVATAFIYLSPCKLN